MSHMNHRRVNVPEARRTRQPHGGRRGCTCHSPDHSKRKAIGTMRKKRARNRAERRAVRRNLP